jgi:hypothetical protein
MRNAERHWQYDDLVRRLYGLEPESGASEEHLVECRECFGRWEALQLVRAEYLSEAETSPVSESRLVSQRRTLWARIDHPGRFWISKWAPVAATSMMLAAGFVLLHPNRPAPAPISQAPQTARQLNPAAQLSDSELFSDLSAMALPAAPKAAEPIRGLFEDSGNERSY